MANYNTFVVYHCEKRKNLLVTSSARKAKAAIYKGLKVQVWNENEHIETIYVRTIEKFDKYINEEKQYIANKQTKAERRNKMRKIERLLNHGFRNGN